MVRVPPFTGFAGVGNSVVLTAPLCTAVHAHSNDGTHVAHAGTRDPSAPLPGEQRRARKTGVQNESESERGGRRGVKTDGSTLTDLYENALCTPCI